MPKPIRIAFVGAGNHLLRAHAAHLKGMEVEIIACCDPSTESYNALVAELGDNHRVTRYKSYADMLNNPEIDAVMIGSPDKYHYEQLHAAVQANKHVFCEKPMCDSEAMLDRLANTFDIAEAKGLLITSCHPRRFDPPYAWVKDNLPSLIARFGAPLEVKLDFMYHKPTKKGLHGNSLLQDHMNHEFDYMNFLFGTSPCTAHKLHDEEDRYHVAGARDDGIVFSFGGSRRLNSRTYAEMIEIRFARATLHIDTYNQQNSYIHRHEEPREVLQRITPGVTNYDVRFAALNRNFVDAVNGVAPNYLTRDEMLANSFMSVAFQRGSTVRCG